MPIEVTDGFKEYRIWSVANQRCLVLKKNNSVLNVTCTGEGEEVGEGEKGSSRVTATEVDGKGPNTVWFYFVFTLDNKKYALHVNKTDNTVTAMEFPGDTPPPTTDNFALLKVVGPFDKCVVGSDDNSKKCIAVNMQNNNLTVELLDGTQRSNTSFVILDADI